MKAIIFNIQRFSIHDGPGIRTVVFLKGCPLRCEWCSNPESGNALPQLYFTASKCIRCSSCVKVAPEGLLSMTKNGLEIDWKKAKSLNNFDWVDVCPTGALEVKGKLFTVEEAYNEIIKDRAFYDTSGGGVTLSGGEPLLQADFAHELLKLCAYNHIHTTIETTGDVPFESIEKVIPYTDLFLYDIKHANNEMHKKWTGKGNSRIIDNLIRLKKSGANMIVRTPLIPGVNDKEDDIKNIISLLNESGIDRYEILPFHQYGSNKYTACGLSYSMADVKPHEEAYLNKMKSLIQQK